jgi:hypothetical protein
MTYLLERIRLAHICREIVDTVPIEMGELLQLPYEHIINLDRKLVDFTSSLPFYFRLDAESRQQAKHLEEINPNISFVRFCITRAAHSRRVKLHQRFLLRQSSDPRYAYSREACLESARAVIGFYDGPAEHGNPWIMTARMAIAMHYMHLALAVLVMDLCFNKGASDEAEVKAEVRAGLKIFEDNRDKSPLLEQFLSSLKTTLQKHKVYIQETVGTLPIVNHSNEEIEQRETPVVSLDASEVTFDRSFDEFWQDAVQGDFNPDLTAWDSLFAGLDSRPL